MGSGSPTCPRTPPSCSRPSTCGLSSTSRSQTSTSRPSPISNAPSQSAASFSMAISSASGQTSTGGPSRPSKANQPDFVLYPAIQESIGYDSNPNRVSPPAKGSFVSRTEADLRLQSDWSNHELNGFLRGAYSVYPDVKGADRPEGEGALRLRLDASRDTKFDVEGRYVLDTQRPGSPELNAPVTARPLVSSF